MSPRLARLAEANLLTDPPPRSRHSATLDRARREGERQSTFRRRVSPGPARRASQPTISSQQSSLRGSRVRFARPPAYGTKRNQCKTGPLPPVPPLHSGQTARLAARASAPADAMSRAAPSFVHQTCRSPLCTMRRSDHTVLIYRLKCYITHNE
jgi:hypothetical protein